MEIKLFKRKEKLKKISDPVDPKFLKLMETFNCFQPIPHKNRKVLLELNNVKRSFIKNFNKFEALKGINLKIYEGEKVALLGANGAGKTTLIEIITSINKPSSGEIKYNFNYRQTPQERIGVQFQDASCPFGFSVYDLINFQNQILVNKLSKIDIINLIRIFKLKDLLKIPAYKLSGGQQQRLNIALAFMCDPKIIFLDELSTALDIDMQFYVNNLIREYVDEHNTTVILSSHNISEILFHTKRCVIMKEGKIVLDAPNEEIIKHFKDFDFFLTNYLKY